MAVDTDGRGHLHQHDVHSAGVFRKMLLVAQKVLTRMAFWEGERMILRMRQILQGEEEESGNL